MKFSTAVGTSSFREIREQGSYYIDKSFLVSELYRTKEKVVLLPRPRRFGKTLNLSMLHCFYDITQHSRPLFEGLAVTSDAAAMAELNSFPTLFLTFKDMDYGTWGDCQLAWKEKISALVGVHLSNLLLAANPIQTKMIQSLHDKSASFVSCGSALSLIIELLSLATSKKVVVLIDEYDNPIHEAKRYGYFSKIARFMRNFLGAGLKDHPHLQRAVVSGILRIGKESIYSGLNNMVVYSLLEPEFSACFGFTEAEVHQLLKAAGLSDQEQAVKSWYNGYTYGKGEIIYNPWSILNFVNKPGQGLVPHWLNTSNNELVHELVVTGCGMTLDDVKRLLAGKSVSTPLDVRVGMRQLTGGSVWNVLLFSGYLTAANWNPRFRTADLSIPNLEVRLFFQETVSDWLGSQSHVNLLVGHLLAERMAEFAKGLAEAVKISLSYFDMAGKNPERVYHIFVVGLVAHLHDRYRIESNRETGHGRADLNLIPRKPGGTGFVFEFKGTPQGDMTTIASEALAQIEQRDYAAVHRDAEVKRLVAIGLVFRAKRIALSSFSQDLVTGERTTTHHYNEGPSEDNHPIPSIGPRPSKQSSDPVQDEALQKAMLVGRIQLLQELKAQEVEPAENLLNQNLSVLRAKVQTLQA